MTTLSDRDLRDHIEQDNIGVEPYEPDNVGPASLDLRLADDIKVAKPYINVDSSFIPSRPPIVNDLDTDRDDHFQSESLGSDGYVLSPGECVLAETMEHIDIPDYLDARVEGRSTVGRDFVEMHVTAGFCDPGFSGTITLEIVNTGPFRYRLERGSRVCQIVFERLTTPAETSYGERDESHYDGQSGPTPARD